MNETITSPGHSSTECSSNVRHITDAIYILQGKWKLPLIFTLRESPKRYNEILKIVEGISPKVLSKELRKLEMNGFVERKVYSIVPLTIIYQATTYSESLKDVLTELNLWGKQHREKIRMTMRN